MIEAENSQPWPNSALYNHGLGGVVFDPFRRLWGCGWARCLLAVKVESR
jgi:hypothetical protein